MFNRHGDAIHASCNLQESVNLQKIIQQSEALVKKALEQQTSLHLCEKV
jgi:hypothetical protein